MDSINQELSFQMLLESLHDDFDQTERLRIFQLLQNSEVSDEALLGVKDFLAANNWDYTLLKMALSKTENRIDSITSHHKKAKSSQKNYLKYAALLIPLAIVSYFTLKTTPSIEEYYITDPGLPNLMSTTSQNEWNHLMELYKSNQFDKAYKYSVELEKSKTKNDTAIYFKGVLAYELKKYDVASADFKTIEQDKKSIFTYDAEFRLGFSLLKSGNKIDAKMQFQKIVLNAESPFSEEAKIILDTFFK